LLERSKDFPVIDAPVSEIREVDETFGAEDRDAVPTCRRVAQHAKHINEADLSHPIILSQSGQVMDGMQRVCKTLRLGPNSIHAVQFVVDPEPGFIDVSAATFPAERRVEALSQSSDTGLRG